MSKYVERHLYENEYIVEKASRDVWGIVGVWVLGVLFCWLLFVPLIIAIKETVIFANTELVLTNKRLIKKTGVFHSCAKDIPLTKIQSVHVDVDFWGKIFNVGIIYIDTPKGNFVTARLQDTDEFKNIILGQIDQYENDRMARQADWNAEALLRAARKQGLIKDEPKQPKKRVRNGRSVYNGYTSFGGYDGYDDREYAKEPALKQNKSAKGYNENAYGPNGYGYPETAYGYGADAYENFADTYGGYGKNPYTGRKN
ncbi:MAG: hypothetical protein E7366_02480 [Clostridiales bacterium]|nr:hypothetical protein [Clostridiales bacterium]